MRKENIPVGKAKLVYCFRKNSQEEVRIYIKTYGHYRVADFRVWRAWGGKAPCPMRKGLTLSVNLLSQLEKGIELLHKRLDIDESTYFGKIRLRVMK